MRTPGKGSARPTQGAEDRRRRGAIRRWLELYLTPEKVALFYDDATASLDAIPRTPAEAQQLLGWHADKSVATVAAMLEQDRERRKTAMRERLTQDVTTAAIGLARQEQSRHVLLIGLWWTAARVLDEHLPHAEIAVAVAEACGDDAGAAYLHDAHWFQENYATATLREVGLTESTLANRLNPMLFLMSEPSRVH